MTDLRDRIVAAVEDADEPLTTLELAGTFNSTIWQINRTVNVLELTNDVAVDHRHHGINRVTTADDDLVADGGTTNWNVASPSEVEEILRQIPTNIETIAFRQFVAGDRESTDIGVDEVINGLLWSDNGVAIRAVDDAPTRTYWVNHNGDLQALSDEVAIRSPDEAAVMLDGELRTETIDVVAIGVDDAPERVQAIGKAIVTDGGRPPLRRCTNCGLIHRPTESCRAAGGGVSR